MAKPRKRHVQLSLPRCDRNGQRRGVGPRKIRHRLGRPPQGPAGSRPRESHGKRQVFRLGTPIHVVVRVAPAIRQLRKDKTYNALRAALLVAARHDNFRVVHVSIQRQHVHLLVEAADRPALTRGMQSFEISAARRLNAALSELGQERRRGCVFPDRYHAQVIESPKQARHCLAYVINNWRHHDEDRGAARGWKIDRYSSAISFDGWCDAPSVWEPPADYVPLPVRPAQSWLLAVGWRTHGLIATTEVPGHKAMPEFAER